MGLLANLRVLATSNIGDEVAALRAELRRLRSDVDDHMDTIERRTRRWQKRERDDERAAAEDAPNGGGTQTPHLGGSPRLRALEMRRAALGRRADQT